MKNSRTRDVSLPGASDHSASQSPMATGSKLDISRDTVSRRDGVEPHTPLCKVGRPGERFQEFPDAVDLTAAHRG